MRMSCLKVRGPWNCYSIADNSMFKVTAKRIDSGGWTCMNHRLSAKSQACLCFTFMIFKEKWIISRKNLDYITSFNYLMLVYVQMYETILHDPLVAVVPYDVQPSVNEDYHLPVLRYSCVNLCNTRNTCSAPPRGYSFSSGCRLMPHIWIIFVYRGLRTLF